MFEPRSIELHGSFLVPTSPEAAFPLFSPAGERAWVPGWDFEPLYPKRTEWERGLVFRTIEEQGEAVWIATLLDRERHDVEYHRVEPGRYVARVRVLCTGEAGGKTRVAVRYAFIGLSESGNRESEAMSEPAFDEKMRRWQGWIEGYLARER